MIYSDVLTGIFISRPNRFLANVEINGHAEVCHVKNTGRCKELLVPGVRVVIEKVSSFNRKTAYDLIGVYKDNEKFINIDSQAPNKVFKEFMLSGKFLDGIKTFRPETVYKNSRFDFYCETDNEIIFIETKGVTLERDNIVLFPDAPTLRGLRHVNELIEATEDGYTAYLIFIVQMKGVKCVKPNSETQPEFAEALVRAVQKGVMLRAYDCNATENCLEINGEIPIIL